MAKYTTEFHNLLVNRPITSLSAAPDYDEKGQPIGHGSINFRVRCMGEDSTEHPHGYEKYPIWNESMRKDLNDKIIHHFYDREIGCETIAQFCDRFLWTMQEIMPKYNQMFKLQERLLADNPMYEGQYAYLLGKKDDYKEVESGTTKTEYGKTLTKSGSESNMNGQISAGGNYDYAAGTTTKNSHAGADNENPEKNIDVNLGVDGTIPPQTYATNTDVSNDYSKTVGGTITDYKNRKDEESGDDTVIHGRTVTHTGTKDIDALDVLERFPDAFINIYSMIFKDLEPLFMQIF